MHRTVIALASAGEGEIKGSARSIPGIHIRDVLSDIATRHPSILTKFGGHAMAAGMSIKISDYPQFALAFDEMVSKHLKTIDASGLTQGFYVLQVRVVTKEKIYNEFHKFVKM